MYMHIHLNKIRRTISGGFSCIQHGFQAPSPLVQWHHFQVNLPFHCLWSSNMAIAVLNSLKDWSCLDRQQKRKESGTTLHLKLPHVPGILPARCLSWTIQGMKVSHQGHPGVQIGWCRRIPGISNRHWGMKEILDPSLSLSFFTRFFTSQV